MDTKKLLKKYYSRLTIESFVKALLLGLVVGFSVLLIFSAVWWIAGLKNVWVCAIPFVVATAAATAILFYKKFYPTVKQTAKRIDALGLEERVLTMAELERETSFIAAKQREDTVFALKKVNEKLIKLTISVYLIVAFAFAAVLGSGMLTMATLAEMGIIKSGKEIIETTDIKKFKLSYEVKGEGTIEGEISQIVEEGKDAAAVMAIPQNGWVFASWSDGYDNPYRRDVKVSTDIAVYATFEEALESDDANDDWDSAQPPDEEEEPPEGDQPGSGPSEGGTYAPNNQIIDNQTYYGGATFNEAYNSAVDQLTKDDNSSKSEKDIIKDYFDTIKQ